MNAKEAAGKCKEYADYEYRQDMLCPHFGTETFERVIQQAIDEGRAEFQAEVKALTQAVNTVQDERAASFKMLAEKVGGVGLTEYQAEVDLEIAGRIEALKAKVKRLYQEIGIVAIDRDARKDEVERLRAENDVFHDWYAYHLDIKDFEALTETLQALDAAKAGKED